MADFRAIRTAVGFLISFGPTREVRPGLLYPLGCTLSDLSTIARAALNAASISNALVSSKAASGAGFMGAMARARSRASRSLSSLRISASERAVAESLQFQPAAMGADFGRGIDEQFGLRTRADDRADIAPVDHSAGGTTGRMSRKVPLKLQKFGTNSAKDRNQRSCFANIGTQQSFVVQKCRIAKPTGISAETRNSVQRIGFLCRIATRIQHFQGNATIKFSRIQMRKSKMLREILRYCSLAAGRRSIDCNHNTHSPLPLREGAKREALRGRGPRTAASIASTTLSRFFKTSRFQNRKTRKFCPFNHAVRRSSCVT